MSYAAQVVIRAGKLVFAVILLSILVAILFCSFSLVLPHDQWTVEGFPIRITAGGAVTLLGGAVTLLIAWARYPAARPWILGTGRK
jgi:hypothetical protein